MFVNRWVTDPFLTPTSTLPVISELAASGVALANVSAHAAGTGFDTLVLQISTQNTNLNTTYWRCYTAPGAPLDIVRLPNLPNGITPAMITNNDPVRALAFAVRFASRATRPWQLPGGDTSNVAYEVTVGGGYQNIASTWR